MEDMKNYAYTLFRTIPLGTCVFLILGASQCWEQSFLMFLRVPNIGNSCFSHFWAFPTSGTMIFVIFSCSRGREQRF